MNPSTLRVLYFGVNPPDKSMRDAPYIAGLKEKGVSFLECYDSSPGLGKFWRLIKKYRAQKSPYDIIFVGHTATTVVPLARLLSRKPIVFNALNPLYDGMVLERETYRPLSPRALFVWLLDFLSFHTAHAILLETNMQIEYVHRHFFAPKRKLFRVFTTVDPSQYRPDPAVRKRGEFLCVFRGYVTPATGAEYILEAARILKGEEVRFRMFARGQVQPLKDLARAYGLSTVEILEGYYEMDKLRRLILEGHVYLGQFGTHPRLDKTIQFKTMEACAFGMPYVTADLPGNRELLHDEVDCLYVRRADAQDLAEKVRMLKRDPALRERLGRAAYALYQRELAPNVLAGQIHSIVQTLL